MNKFDCNYDDDLLSEIQEDILEEMDG